MVGASSCRVPVIPKPIQKSKPLLKNFAQAIQATLATRDPDDRRPVLKMAEDEGRFGRVSIPRRAWAPPGVRPQAPHQIVREYTHVYAAVAPAEGKMTSLLLPSADTEMMNLLTFACVHHVCAVLCGDASRSSGMASVKSSQDPGKYPTDCSACLQSRAQSGEHVWEEVREKHLANLALASLDEVIDKVCDGLNQLEADPQRLRSMTYFPHFRSIS